jgi:hypothetical protein
MNFPRVLLAALAVWVLYLALGALIHGVMLADLWIVLQRQGLTRSPSTWGAYAPLGYALALPGALAFAYTYAKGYEGGPGMQEGLRFGVLVGLMLVAFGLTWSYVTFPVPLQFLTSMSIATVIEFAVLGMAAGLVYGTRST